MKDGIQNGLTLLAILLASSALVVSIISLRSDQAARQENVQMDADFVRSDHETEVAALGFSRRDLEGSLSAPPSGTVEFRVDILVSNIGERDVSLTKYDLWEIHQSGSRGNYLGMDKGLYEMGSDGELIPVEMPFLIPAGHSKRMFLKVGVLLHERAFKIVEREFGLGEESSSWAIGQRLAQEGLDYFGAYNEGNQEFVLLLQTGGGTDLYADFQWFLDADGF